MKITANRDVLASFCALSKQITGQKTSNSFTKCIHLSIIAGQLHIRATNLEQHMRQVVDCKIQSPSGDALVDAEILSKITKLSSDQELLIDSDGPVLTIRSSFDVWKINTSDPTDFPPWNSMESGAMMKMSGIDLCSGIKKCLPMIAQEKGRYALNGVSITFSGGRIEFCGTDGRRLARVRHPCFCGDTQQQIIIPSSASEMILSITTDGEVEIGATTERLFLRVGVVEMYSRLVEGQFPEYEQVIPKNLDKSAKFECGDLVVALEKAKLLTTPESQAVRMALSPGHLSISSRSAALGQSEVSCSAMYGGQLIEIGFDPKYLLDALSACDADSVELKLRDKDEGTIIHSGREEQEMYLVMPIDI